jgi:hypothetical protein
MTHGTRIKSKAKASGKAPAMTASTQVKTKVPSFFPPLARRKGNVIPSLVKRLQKKLPLSKYRSALVESTAATVNANDTVDEKETDAFEPMVQSKRFQLPLAKYRSAAAKDT